MSVRSLTRDFWPILWGMQIIRGTVVTMNPQREILTHGAVVVDGTTIAMVDSFDKVRTAYPDAVVTGSPNDLVLPGYINGHQHLTGDRLIQSSIPDNLAPGEAIFTWVVPVRRRRRTVRHADAGRIFDQRHHYDVRGRHGCTP
jgi:cytosine/adenosine deaminase-related metal-dependent hydrolase